MNFTCALRAILKPLLKPGDGSTIFAITELRTINTAAEHRNKSTSETLWKEPFECGKNKSNENFKTTIPNNNYDRPKTTGECGMFQMFG